MNSKSNLVCIFISLLVVVRAQSQQISSSDLMALLNDDFRPVEVFRQFKKSFVRPCVYNMGNCITTTQQERLLKHLRSLVALREQP